MKLVSQRQKCSRVEELGGHKKVERFFALCEVRAHESEQLYAKG